MITLAHISDVHLGPLPHVRPAELMNKRITGYLNWKLRRRRHLTRDTLSPLIDHLKSVKPGFTAVTGDLVNLALDAEFEKTADWLKRLGPADKVCAIPGNHDNYVPGALARARKHWNGYMQGETLDEAVFPFVRRVGDLAIIGCSSAVTTPPFFAAGNFDDAQADRLTRCLALLGDAGYFRVILIHHAPNKELADFTRGLWGADRFRNAVAQCGAELVLHGHTHRSSTYTIEGPGKPVPVIGVAAASANAHVGEDPARYNLFRIEKVGSAWSCTMREYGYQRIDDEIVMRLQMRIH